MTKDLRFFFSWQDQNIVLCCGNIQISPVSHSAFCSVGTGALFLGVKLLGKDADPSPATSAEVKKEWIFTSAPSWLHSVCRDNFTLILQLPCFWCCHQQCSVCFCLPVPEPCYPDICSYFLQKLVLFLNFSKIPLTMHT